MQTLSALNKEDELKEFVLNIQKLYKPRCIFIQLQRFGKEINVDDLIELKMN